MDVCVGRRGVALLRRDGHDVVVVADLGEPDREWFARAVARGVEVVISPDRDLKFLAWDARIEIFVPRQRISGATIAQLFCAKYHRRREALP